MTRLVAGVDSSTQSTKVVLCDAATGEIVGRSAAPHPDGTECDPAHWWTALERGRGLLERANAVAVAGQQHGMIVLDEANRVIRPALLWNDLRSAGAARDLIGELGGPAAWVAAVGSVPVASFTVTKLRWLAEHEPWHAGRVARVLLPHDWLTWRLMATAAAPVTDRGDASGTGYWSPAAGTWRTDLAERALGQVPGLPAVLGGGANAGRTGWGAVLAPGTGDNMAAALGLGLRTGDVAVSLGTSGTAFAMHPSPVGDPTGAVAGFADAAGGFLPLVCTLNAALVLAAAARALQVEPAGFDRLALAAPPGAAGLTLLPYLDGERTPDLPTASGSLLGLTRTSMTPENLARAAVEGMLCGLADGVDALRRTGVPVDRVVLIGGAARSTAVQRIAPPIFGVPVAVPPAGEYVALGAARQAAWALSGEPSPPGWPAPAATPARDPEPHDIAAAADVRQRYAAYRHTLFGA